MKAGQIEDFDEGEIEVIEHIDSKEGKYSGLELVIWELKSLVW